MKTPNSLRSRLTALGMIATQLAFALPASAAESSPRSPEFRWLESAYALQGLKLSNTQRTERLNAITRQYAAESRDESPQEQLSQVQQALVDLQVYTPAQVESITQKLENSSDPMNSQEIARIVSGETANGAQFSACSEGLASAAIVAGIVGMVVGAYFASNTEECPFPTQLWSDPSGGPDFCAVAGSPEHTAPLQSRRSVALAYTGLGLAVAGVVTLIVMGATCE